MTGDSYRYGERAYYVGRTLRTVELLASRARSTREIAMRLGVDQRTARRLLKRLADLEWASYDRRNRTYRLTPRLLDVAESFVGGHVDDEARLTDVSL